MEMQTRYEIIANMVYNMFDISRQVKDLTDDDIYLLNKMLKEYRSMVDDIPFMLKHYPEQTLTDILQPYLKTVFYSYFRNLMGDEDIIKQLYAQIYYACIRLDVKKFFFIMTDVTDEYDNYKIIGVDIISEMTSDEYFDMEKLRAMKAVKISSTEEIEKDFHLTYAIYIDIVVDYLTQDNYEIPTRGKEIPEQSSNN